MLGKTGTHLVSIWVFNDVKDFGAKQSGAPFQAMVSSAQKTNSESFVDLVMCRGAAKRLCGCGGTKYFRVWRRRRS